MDTTHSSPADVTKPHTHPLVLIAATAVTVLSLAGVATLAGWLPGPGSQRAEPTKVAPAAAQTPTGTASGPQTDSVLPEKTAAKPASEHAPISARRTAPTPTSRGPAIAVSPAPTFSSSAPPLTPPQPAICRECGVVEAVREVAVEPKGSGGGAVAGGVVGGIIGNQVGKGATRDIATVLGAVGGAFAGNQIEKSVKQSKRYDVVVRFDDGSSRSISSDSPPAWQSGDRVRLQNGALTAGGRSASN